jgi:heme-degrading monooxygenase HmoA
MRGTENMIIREWRGRALRNHADAYPKHFRESVLPELQKLPGFLGAHLCQRELEQRVKVEILILTRLESMDAIRAFAGASIDKAVVEPAAVAALSDFDDTVRHYVVLEEVRADSAISGGSLSSPE